MSTPDSSRGLDEDEAILRRFLSGEREACRRVEGWAREIARLRPRMVPPDEIDDVVQETLVSLWRSCARPGFALRVGLRPLVRRVAVARCIDALRRRREQVPLDETVAVPSATGCTWLGDDIEAMALRRALRAVESRCRDLVRLYYLDGLSYAEISPRLDRPVPTLRVDMFRCMKRLRALLEGSGP